MNALLTQRYGPDHEDNLAAIRSARNLERAILFEKAIFEHRSRYLALFLTFNYCRDWSPFVTLNQLRRDRDTLFNNGKKASLFEGLERYVWKLEEGQKEGGMHMHVVFFWNGAYRSDILIARDIGEYWCDVVTRGIGSYWNSNADKNRHGGNEASALGQIDRGNSIKRSSLRTLLGYLAKEDGRVPSRINPHVRMFGTSSFPNED